jgi:hypothetical protein
MLSFALNLMGALVIIAGVAWIATLLGVAHIYVTSAAAILLAIAIFAAVRRRTSEPPPA